MDVRDFEIHTVILTLILCKTSSTFRVFAAVRGAVHFRASKVCENAHVKGQHGVRTLKSAMGMLWVMQFCFRYDELRILKIFSCWDIVGNQRLFMKILF